MSVNLTALTIILSVLPMVYLLLASPAFLLVRLDTPPVAYLLRTMFFGYFFALVVVGWVAATLMAFDGRLVPSVCIGLVTALAVVWRRWMMRRVDALLAEIEAGLAGGAPRLRRLHWLGMAINALLLASVLALVPAVFVAA